MKKNYLFDSKKKRMQKYMIFECKRIRTTLIRYQMSIKLKLKKINERKTFFLSYVFQKDFFGH